MRDLIGRGPGLIGKDSDLASGNPELLDNGADLVSAALRIRNAMHDGFHVENRRSPQESRKWGKSLRKQIPRSSHGKWEVPENREDPLDLLREQAKTRVPELVPIRYERMAASPFSYFRGCALPMAADLSKTPASSIMVQACGDAHVANFGIYASPERRMVFDINDFDETLPGPWEWDVKRLAASIEICARDRGFTDEERHAAVLGATSGYREAILEFAQMGTLDVWYAHFDVDWVFEHVLKAQGTDTERYLQKVVSRAQEKNSSRAISKFTEVVDGNLQIKSDPPILVPLREIESVRELGLGDIDHVSRVVQHVIRGYRLSLPLDRQRLIDQYRGVDMAHKVVGVGSVGLRAWIIVMEGASSDDPLVLQAKEARASVLERYMGKSRYIEHGRRVVEGQRAMQSASDIFLGWTREIDDSGTLSDYYVRQLWDSKGSIDLETIPPEGLEHLAKACGWVLAHAHARTGNRFAIAGYLGSGDQFDRALVNFADAYADQNQRDYDRFLEAYRDGKM